MSVVEKYESVTVEIESRNTKLVFGVGDRQLVQPLKTSGHIWHVGWDIPTRYAVDSAGTVWMDNAHGGTLWPATAEELVCAAQSEEGRNHLRKILDLPATEPSWIEQARAAGWRPPSDQE